MARETYTRRQARHYEERNYIGEAKELVKGLDKIQLYELYEIVNDKLRQSNTMKREKELEAVKSVIENIYGLDVDRLARIRRGRGEMSKDARARDGQTTVNRKKV